MTLQSMQVLLAGIDERDSTEPDDLITLADAAKLVGVSEPRIDALVNKGKLAVYLRATGRRPVGQRHVSRSELLTYRARPRQVGRKRLTPGDDDPRHGTVNGYRNLDCRCSRCCAANTAEHSRSKQQARTGQPPADLKHGTNNSRYYWRCQCEVCSSPLR